MKTLILFMLVSMQAFTQSMIFHQKVNSVTVFKVMELSDSKKSIIYKFSNQREVIPIQVNDTTWRIDVPMNEFSMILINNKEWVGIKPNGFKYNATVPFVFGDGFMTVVEFNSFSKQYTDHFYGDLLVYNP
jgi:hypothetical protein